MLLTLSSELCKLSAPADMRYFTKFILIFFCIHMSHQRTPSVALINSIFTSPPTPTTIPNNSDPPCDCVPYYLCTQNNKIITDGHSVILPRFGDDNVSNVCPHYFEWCCQKEFQIKQPILPERLVSRKGCGYIHEDGIQVRIKRDDHARFGEFPWMTAILKQESNSDGSFINKYKCGGALIHPRAVITAAHCLGKNKKYTVRVGEWDPQTTLEILEHQEMAVQKIISHPKFYSGGLHNDIAILILEKEVAYNNHIDIICLPPQDYVVPDRSACIACGWGKDNFESNGTYQAILKKIDLPFVERERCQELLRKTRVGKYFILDQSLVCAGGNEAEDTCEGDGGSPLICPIPGYTDRYLHAGIVSWGIDCGLKDVPGAYANVALFRNWIDQQMTLNNLDISEYQY